MEKILKNPEGKSRKDLIYTKTRLAEQYMNVARYDEALKLLTEALADYESKPYDGKIYADMLSRMGDIYNYLGRYEQSYPYYSRAIRILEKYPLDKVNGTLTTTLNNSGSVYINTGHSDSAELNYKKALKISNEFKLKRGAAMSLGNLGYLYEMEGKFDDALKNYLESYQLSAEEKDAKGQSFTLTSIGYVYTAKEMFDEAESHFLQAADVARVAGMKSMVRDAYEGLTELYRQQGKLEKALDYQKRLYLIFDSLYNVESNGQIAEMNAKYESEKKDKKLLEQKAEADIKDAEAKQNEKERLFLIIGLLVLGVLFIFIFKGYRDKKKANILISSQKDKVEMQKHEIEEKNKDIADSISYAKRIQQSFLGSQEEFENAFEDYFILYQPKDVISGDCYWIANVKTTPKDGVSRKITVMAAIDCTGHGVPGALMSIVGMTLLNQTMKNKDINSCADALDYLNRELPKNVKSKEGESVRDGMDISMCTFFHDKLEMNFAAANNPAYLIREGELRVLKADKQPVTAAVDVEKKPFASQNISLQKGDCIYLFTDGFADQFGGEKSKKFTYKKLQETLLNSYSIPMTDQKSNLEKVFSDWKGKQEQIDDVLVIGIRI